MYYAQIKGDVCFVSLQELPSGYGRGEYEFLCLEQNPRRLTAFRQRLTSAVVLDGLRSAVPLSPYMLDSRAVLVFLGVYLC